MRNDIKAGDYVTRPDSGFFSQKFGYLVEESRNGLCVRDDDGDNWSMDSGFTLVAPAIPTVPPELAAWIQERWGFMNTVEECLVEGLLNAVYNVRMIEKTVIAFEPIA